MSDRIPTMCRHRSTGQAYVTINGKEVYLGKYGSKQAKRRYDEVINQWLAHGRNLPSAEAGLTINELILAYVKHAKGYYQPVGRKGGELACIKDALRIVKSLFGTTPASDFGPKKLKCVRQAMLDKGWCRTNVNHQIDRVRRSFRWAVSEELLPGDVYHALQSVPALRRGMPGVRESEPVRPAPVDLINAALPLMPTPVGAMVEIQLLSGCRPSEACAMRACDIDMTGKVWIYTPKTHKTAHHGHARTIYLGPRAQEIVRIFLTLNTEAYLFSPAVSEASRNAKRRENRVTPLWESHKRAQAKMRKRPPKRPKGQSYEVDAYRRAIARACERAFPPPAPLAKLEGETGKEWKARLDEGQRKEFTKWRKAHSWHPHQLRHNAATNLRREHGVELARIILGHSSLACTAIYAEADQAKALDVIRQVG